MYFRRYIDPHLKEWKESVRRKPLLLRGARQVGKSRSIRHLGESFAYFAEVNFETRPELRQIFKEVSDVREIVSRLGTLLNIPIVEDKTLLFLDEIQPCPEAIMVLRFFKEDLPALHIIAARSLLDILPVFWVHSEFTPVRTCPCWANKNTVKRKTSPRYTGISPKCFNLVQQRR